MDVIAPVGFTWIGFLATMIGAGIVVPISGRIVFPGRALFTWFRQRYNFPIALLAVFSLFAFGHIDTIGVVASSLVLAVANAWAFEAKRCGRLTTHLPDARHNQFVRGAGDLWVARIRAVFYQTLNLQFGTTKTP